MHVMVVRCEKEHPRTSVETWTFAEALGASRRAPSDPCLSSRPAIPEVGPPTVEYNPQTSTGELFPTREQVVISNLTLPTTNARRVLFVLLLSGHGYHHCKISNP